MKQHLKMFYDNISAICDSCSESHRNIILFGTPCCDCVFFWFKTNNKTFNKNQLKFFFAKFQSLPNYEHYFCRILCQRGTTLLVFSWLLYLYFLLFLQKISKTLNFGVFEYMTETNLDYIFQIIISSTKKLPDLTLQSFCRINKKLFGTNLGIPLINYIQNSVSTSLKTYSDCFEGVALMQKSAWKKSSIFEKAASDLPTANFLCAVIRSYINIYCNESSRYLLPMLDFNSKNELIKYATAHTLKKGLLASVIDLPFLCYKKLKCMRKTPAVEVTVCKNCGYCVNLGKTKLKTKYMFPLNSLFYYRDQQEKTINFSSRYDVPHCSLCGSFYLVTMPLYSLYHIKLKDWNIYVPVWRAVIGNNTGCCLLNEKPLDVLTLCSNRTCFNTAVIRDIAGKDLAYLLSHSASFLCSHCKTDLSTPTTDNCVTCSFVKHHVCTR